MFSKTVQWMRVCSVERERGSVCVCDAVPYRVFARCVSVFALCRAECLRGVCLFARCVSMFVRCVSVRGVFLCAWQLRVVQIATGGALLSAVQVRAGS